MTYPPYPQQPGGDGYQHPENDHGGYASPQYQQQQYQQCQPELQSLNHHCLHLLQFCYHKMRMR